MRLGYALLSCSKIVVGSVILMLIMNPMQYASDAQKAILAEYDGLYCMPVAEARKNGALYQFKFDAADTFLERSVLKID